MKLQNTLNLFRLNTVVMLILLAFSLSAGANDETVEDFSFEDVKGKTHKLSDYRGKWVIVNYWAVYCSPCLEEIPDLVKFSNKHKKDTVVIGIDAGGTDVADLREFAAKQKMDYLLVPAEINALTAFGIVNAIPTTYVVTPEGQVAERFLGPVTSKVLEQVMQLYATSDATNDSIISETEDITDL